MQRRKAHQQHAKQGVATIALLLFSACAADPKAIPKKPPKEIFSDPEADRSPGVRIELKHSNFFSLSSPIPNGNSCAGDAKTYFHPFKLQTPNASVAASAVDPTTYDGPDPYAAALGTEQGVPFSEDPLNSYISYRPGFLKNVSVDLTDSNVASDANQAISCSLATTPSSPPPSNCATFDYGAIGGIPTDMGGTLLLAGGVNGANGSGYDGVTYSGGIPGPGLACGINSATDETECRSDVFALKIDALPASAAGSDDAPGAPSTTTAPISMFTQLASSSSTATFQAVAGASAAYNPMLKRVVIFGGSGTDGLTGYDTDLTQIYDVTTQNWSDQSAPNKVTAASIASIYDSGTGPTGSTYTISKFPGSRSLFGYAAVPVSALGLPTDDGDVNDGDLDTTDRIYIAGGLTTTLGPMGNTYRFTPTFGPDVHYISSNASAPPGAVGVHQWPESSPFTLMSHIGPTGSLYLDLPSAVQVAPSGIYAPTSVPSRMLNFGMAPTLLTLTDGTLKGSVVMTAGFDYLWDKIGFGYPSATGAHITYGQIRVFAPISIGVGGTGPAGPLPNEVGEVMGTPTQRDQGYRLRPNDWAKPHLWSTVAYSEAFPWYGGSSLLQGASTSEFVMIGGSRCQGYLSDPTLISGDGCFSTTDTGRRFSLALNNGELIPSVATQSTPAAWTGASLAPALAGMATARGMFSTTPIIAAFGGIDDTRFASNQNASPYVYVLNLSTGLWQNILGSGGPPQLSNAAIVYSHITGKFYLFGGQLWKDESAPRAETWELTINSLTTLSVSWRQLSPTCYPSCPQARKSHRMVEVNYHNVDPTTEPDCTDANAPCSFGIFMEGGSADQLETSILGDRWMFDPTGAPSSSSSSPGPHGHWQRVDNNLPPRRLAALASYSYALPFTGQQIHRALLFGGETALSNPQQGISGDSFVAPTLGDTYLYDFAANTWNRVKLLGQGTLGTITASPFSLMSRFDRIQTYALAPLPSAFTGLATLSGSTATGLVNSNLRHFSPPPLAGATMVTRLYPMAINDSVDGTPVKPLPIPEVFLFGGRKKSGKFASVGDVWKFCTSSPGERPATSTTDPYDHAECDAYVETENENSVSPTAEYTGRWLYKTPQGRPLTAGVPGATGTPATTTADALAGSYLGAGTYNPIRDRILLVGGLAPSGAPVPAGEPDMSVTSGIALTGYNTVLEYTPPTKTYSLLAEEINGFWDEVPNCPRVDGDEPIARYGHSLSFDSLNNQLVLVGGYRAVHVDATDYQGLPLTQTVTLAGSDLSIPEVYTGTRFEAAPLAGEPAYDEIDFSASPTFPCYLWRKKSVFGNSPYIQSKGALTGSVSFAASTFIPSGGYNTGYYSLFDSACAKQGPVNTTDSSISKLLAGGVYIDLDRSKMGTTENLVLNLTFIALGPDHRRPDGANYDPSEAAQLKIHLIRTGLSLDSIQAALQPRHLQYSSLDEYPQVVDTLAVLAPPASGLRQEQVILPISASSTIDRIRIERYSGSAILIDASVFRTQPAPETSP